MMEPIKNLTAGQEFYFDENRSKIFVLEEHQKRASGTIKGAKCRVIGKLYPVYLSARHMVNVLVTPIINKIK